MIRAPWTKEQVDALNRWQHCDWTHEFTCGNDHALCRVLTATEAGWVCPCCDYTQNWAHEFMLDPPPNPFTGELPGDTGHRPGANGNR